MSKLRTVGRTFGRRAFLVGSVAVAGGVAFGTYLARRAPENPLLADAREGQANFNPWVRIDADGITLVGPHVDLGQGAAHAQAVLVAEELDVALDQIETSFGRPSAAYWNTAMAGEAVPFMATDRVLRGRNHARRRRHFDEGRRPARHRRLQHHARQFRQAARRWRERTRDAEAGGGATK